jgi:hypothetical protein
MRTRARQLWPGFIEQTVGCLALVAVAVLRSPSDDPWPSLALLVVAYVGGIMVAAAILEQRLPFVRGRRPDVEPDVDVSIGIVLAVGVVVFWVPAMAFGFGAWPPTVRGFAVAVATISAGTIGWGIAASGAASPITRPFGRSRVRVLESGLGRWFHRGMPPA